jgi:hypothetical protein
LKVYECSIYTNPEYGFLKSLKESEETLQFDFLSQFLVKVLAFPECPKSVHEACLKQIDSLLKNYEKTAESALPIAEKSKETFAALIDNVSPKHLVLFITAFRLGDRFDSQFLAGKVIAAFEQADYKGCSLIIMYSKLFSIKNFDYLNLFYKLAADKNNRKLGIQLLCHLP